MKRDIVWTSKFKKDYKLAIKRNLNIELLDNNYPCFIAGGGKRCRRKIRTMN